MRMQMLSVIVEKKFDILKWHWRKQHKPEDIGEGVCLWAFAHRPAPPFPASTPGPPSLPPEAGIERGGGGGLTAGWWVLRALWARIANTIVVPGGGGIIMGLWGFVIMEPNQLQGRVAGCGWLGLTVRWANQRVNILLPFLTHFFSALDEPIELNSNGKWVGWFMGVARGKQPTKLHVRAHCYNAADKPSELHG